MTIAEKDCYCEISSFEAAIFSDSITKCFQIAWNFVNQVIISTLLIKFDVNFYFVNVFRKIQLIPCRSNDLEN